MSSSRKKLIAKIAQTEDELYCYKKNTLFHKEYIRNNAQYTLLGLLIVPVLLFLWLGRKKYSVKLRALSKPIISGSKIALLTYLKKQAVQFLR